MENLDLFTPVEDALPQDNSKVMFISTSKDGKLYHGFGTFFEKDEWQRQNVFIGDGYHFIDGELQLPQRHWNVTHWLDLSKLTTKQEVEDLKEYDAILIERYNKLLEAFERIVYNNFEGYASYDLKARKSWCEIAGIHFDPEKSKDL